mmetsp:Transcript_66904/g.211746  ORF Transcript_66904/g.211746 Transcript_66904/m.211746 type:complete len:227 (-) Transcript_66904:304-984(-)
MRWLVPLRPLRPPLHRIQPLLRRPPRRTAAPWRAGPSRPGALCGRWFQRTNSSSALRRAAGHRRSRGWRAAASSHTQRQARPGEWWQEALPAPAQRLLEPQPRRRPPPARPRRSRVSPHRQRRRRTRRRRACWRRGQQSCGATGSQARPCHHPGSQRRTRLRRPWAEPRRLFRHCPTRLWRIWLLGPWAKTGRLLQRTPPRWCPCPCPLSWRSPRPQRLPAQARRR